MMCTDEQSERDPRGRVAYIAGKRLGSAPKRSRAKRVLREAARLEGAPWFGLRVVLIARESILHKSLTTVRHDISRGLHQLAGSTNQAVVLRSER